MAADLLVIAGASSFTASILGPLWNYKATLGWRKTSKAKLSDRFCRGGALFALAPCNKENNISAWSADRVCGRLCRSAANSQPLTIKKTLQDIMWLWLLISTPKRSVAAGTFSLDRKASAPRREKMEQEKSRDQAQLLAGQLLCNAGCYRNIWMEGKAWMRKRHRALMISA